MLELPVRKKFMGQKPVSKSGQELWQFSMPREASCELEEPVAYQAGAQMPARSALSLNYLSGEGRMGLPV